MSRIREVLVVEGRYDKIRLDSVVEATILPVDGFHVFHDDEQMRLLRELAETRGLIILTDSDSAGFVIRDHLSGCIPPHQIKHAYIPEIEGKERRKAIPGKEGLLGVEGMSREVLLEALRRAGATFEDEEKSSPSAWMTKQRLYADGLIGQDNSAGRRRALLRLWGYPEKISANRLVELINAAKSPPEYADALKRIENPEKIG